GHAARGDRRSAGRRGDPRPWCAALHRAMHRAAGSRGAGPALLHVQPGAGPDGDPGRPARPAADRFVAWYGPPHSWGGGAERAGRAHPKAPLHSWGGGAERAGGAHPKLLPIHGEVARNAPEGLTQATYFERTDMPLNG